MFLTRFKKAGDFMVKTGGCFITIKKQNKNKNQNSHQYYLVSMMSTLKNTENYMALKTQLGEGNSNPLRHNLATKPPGED